jgi:5-methylcytosine-specific restriction endonuclease McrA
LGEGKKEEDFKLIECVKLEERAGKRRHEDPILAIFRQQILRRDSWRCQSCGTRSNLEVHHKEFRSHSGADSQVDLITLCTACHARVHRR